MLNDVRITVSDGQLASGSGDGVHVKIGASPVAYSGPIAIKNTLAVKRIRERLGLSPLADACMDSLENGAKLIYCIPVTPSTQGTVGEITKAPADADNSSTGTLAITGHPNNRYDIAVKITKSGGFNEAALKYSFDGGVSWSEEATMPVGGELSVPPTGLTLTFTEGAGPTKFAVGDLFSAATTAPQMSNDDILKALDHVREVRDTVEFIHIVGETTEALWASLAVEAENFFSIYFKPVFFLVEARRPTTDESVRQYVDALVEARKKINSYFVQAVAAQGRYTRMDRTTQSINLAGVVSGLYARAGVAQSISEIASFQISEEKLLELEPTGVEDELDLLDEAGYLTIRRYEGYAGFFVTRPNMLSPEGSDYRYAEHVRVLNKAARLVRATALLQLHKSINLDKQDEELEAMGKLISAPLEDMADAGEISSGSVEVPTDQDILHDETLHVILRFVPRGYVRTIEVDLGMTNPNAKGAE